jgi:hypothetical protein
MTTIPYIDGKIFLKQESNGELTYIENELYSLSLRNVPGQINRQTSFGSFLYNLAKDGPQKWLEVGTWNGLGSTKCILDGFHHRNDGGEGQLISYELDPVMYNVAKENLAQHPEIKCVEFVFNKLKSAMFMPEYFPAEDEIDIKESHFILYYEREKALFNKAEGVIPRFKPQVVVLDGGEYSGYNDWLQLDKSELQWICLDDANTFKSKQIIDELKGMNEWKCVEMHPDERNGWAVYKNAFRIHS